MDVRLQNKQTATLRVERIVIRYPGAAIAPHEDLRAADDEVALTSFQSVTFRIPETRLQQEYTTWTGKACEPRP